MLEEIKDPFGDGPFEYRKLDDGFELSSKLVYEGAPVKLTFGAAATAAKYAAIPPPSKGGDKGGIPGYCWNRNVLRFLRRRSTLP